MEDVTGYGNCNVEGPQVGLSWGVCRNSQEASTLGLGSTGAEQEGLREGRVPELCLASCGIPPSGILPLEVRVPHEHQAGFWEWATGKSHLALVVWVLSKKTGRY